MQLSHRHSSSSFQLPLIVHRRLIKQVHIRDEQVLEGGAVVQQRHRRLTHPDHRGGLDLSHTRGQHPRQMVVPQPHLFCGSGRGRRAARPAAELDELQNRLERLLVERLHGEHLRRAFPHEGALVRRGHPLLHVRPRQHRSHRRVQPQNPARPRRGPIENMCIHRSILPGARWSRQGG